MRPDRRNTVGGTGPEGLDCNAAGPSRQQPPKRSSTGPASAAAPNIRGKQATSGRMKPGTGERLGDAQTSSSHRRVDHVPVQAPASTSASTRDLIERPLLRVHEANGEARAYIPPSVPPSLPRMFKAYGIEAYRTRARINEICILFTIAVCPRGPKCYRIHPKDIDLYRGKLQDKSSLSLFRKNWDPPTSGSESDEDETTEEGSEAERSEEPLEQEGLEEDDEEDTPSENHDESASSSSHNESLILQSGEDDWGPPQPWDTSRWFEGSASRRSSDTEEDEMPPRARRIENPEMRRRPYISESHRAPVSNIQREEEKPQQIFQPTQHPPPRIINHNTSLASTNPQEQAVSTPFRREQRFKVGIICQSWVEGRCWKGRACPYAHHELLPNGGDIDAPPVSLIERHALPPRKEICARWLEGKCERGYACIETHRDLDYDESLPRRHIFPVPLRKPPEIFTRPIHKHIKIKISDGFEIMHITTGFETSWVYLGNIPHRTSQSTLSRILKRHGELIEVVMPETSASIFVTVKARFTSPPEASKACATLNGLEAFGSTITARLSLEDWSGAGVIHDTSVRITWEAPTRPAFLGYHTLESSNAGFEKCNNAVFEDRTLRVSVHTALPAVARYNLRFDGVPADTDRQALKEFAKADDIVWGPINYTDGRYALNRLRTVVKGDNPDSVQFELMPPPYRAGIMVAYAHFSTPAEAKALCDRLHYRKPKYLGLTRITARHEQTLEYSINPERYLKARNDLEGLKATSWAMWHAHVNIDQTATSVKIQLKGEDAQQLRRLKAQLDVALWGEVLIDEKQRKAQWDPFFLSPAGGQFVYGVHRQHPSVTIRVESLRRRIRLFGPAAVRDVVRRQILDKLNELRSKTVYELEVDGRIMGLFMNDELPELTRSVGQHNVFLNLKEGKLSVRGDSGAKDQAYEALTRAKRTYRSASDRPRALVECPVCFNDVVTPVTLCCGHSWCKTCMIRYLMTAIDQKFFPLTCLGNNAKCGEKIPLTCAKQLLNAGDFEKLIETAFTTHVKHHPGEFAYCPTPDCQQIYRPIPRNKAVLSSSCGSSSKSAPTPVTTNLQCPSCLVRFCASCQSEAHAGMVCTREDERDELFQEWVEANDIRRCPGCKVPIEKATGCHHMTCTVCGTHHCWVCMKPFPNGSGVYSHMLAMHGSYV